MKIRQSAARTPSTSDPKGFRRALLAHFDRSRRPLPWRSERTPYRVLVSEFMLQQTRAETVMPYYDSWLRRFPGWDALADASTDEVILQWKGLGYYARARNLHRTAQAVRERYGGRLPEDPAVLKTLPGVGEYTAGAVASIAFGRPVPAVDGNVRRVLSRLLDVGDPTAAQLRHEAARLLDLERPGDFNEAMMELGATVCTPRAPLCGACPVTEYCKAKAAGTVAERPVSRKGRHVPQVEYATVVVADDDAPTIRTLLAKRPETGLLAGMWEFPSAELGGEDARDPHLVTAAALNRLATFGLTGEPTAPLPPVRHAFTHFRATYNPVIVRCPRDAAPHALPPGTAWVDPARLDEWALPVAQQKIGALLGDWLRP